MVIDKVNYEYEKIYFNSRSFFSYDTLDEACKNLEAYIEKKDVSCFESNDGELEVIVSGGTEPYTIEWSNTAIDQFIGDLASGNIQSMSQMQMAKH